MTDKDMRSEQWWKHEVSNAWAEGYEKGRASVKQPEQEPVAWADKYDIERDGHDFWVSRQQPAKNGVPLYTAPPQSEWQNAALRLGEELSTVGPDGYYNMSASEWLDWAMKHITPARIEQEPVAWFIEGTYADGTPSFAQVCETDPEFYVPLYAAPPQREWKGLTVDEFYDLDDVGRKMILEYGRLVEAKLKEKNAA